MTVTTAPVVPGVPAALAAPSKTAVRFAENTTPAPSGAGVFLCKPVTQHCAFAKKIYAMLPKWGKQSLHGSLILSLFLEWTGCRTFCVAKNDLNGVMLFLRRPLRISTCSMAHKLKKLHLTTRKRGGLVVPFSIGV